MRDSKLHFEIYIVLTPKETEQYRENDADDYHGRNRKEKSTVFRLYTDVAG